MEHATSASTVCAVTLSASAVATPNRASAYMGVYPRRDVARIASGTSSHMRRTTDTETGAARALESFVAACAGNIAKCRSVESPQ